MEPINGIYCAYNDCSDYDGKRCKKLGHQPTSVCEPYAQELFNEKRRKINSAGDKKFPSSLPLQKSDVVRLVEQYIQEDEIGHEPVFHLEKMIACLVWVLINERR